jgi:hypothetical protein
VSTEHPIFYGKPLTFNEPRHMYFWGGQPVPSVTTIIGRLDKPGLVWWAAEEAVKHLRAAWGRNKAVLHDATIWEDARKAHDRIKRSAGDIGTVLHDVAEAVQRGVEPDRKAMEKLPAESQLIASNCAIALKEWLAEQTFAEADLERKVMSRELMYAGRCDCFGVINGQLSVLDYKSGGDRIYPETWVQMAAYEIALREELGIPEHEPIWHRAVHLSKKTGKCTPAVRGPYHTIAAKQAWRQLVMFDRWMRQVPTDAQMARMAG